MTIVQYFFKFYSTAHRDMHLRRVEMFPSIQKDGVGFHTKIGDVVSLWCWFGGGREFLLVVGWLVLARVLVFPAQRAGR